MQLKYFAPKTPGTRHRISILHNYGKRLSLRKLQIHKQSQNKGGGHFKNYRLIEWFPSLFNIPGIIKKFVYDPYRSAILMYVVYNNGISTYKIAVHGLNLGDQIITGDHVDLSIGNTLPLKYVPKGMQICLIETNHRGITLCRRAGTYATVLKKDLETGYAILSLKSGVYKSVPLNCFVTIGQVANIDHKNTVKGKAGVSRWQGIRPHVRGMAQNSVDHPSTCGKQPVNSKGQLAKGIKTRKKPINIRHFFKI